ncbi:MAG: hypothetical protein ABJE47_25770, partial [bacterium]
FPFGTLRPVRDGFVERNGVKSWYAVYGEKGPWIAFAPIFQITPYAATYLARTYGLQYVGYYLCGGAVLSLAGLAAMRETKDDVLFSASAALPVT